MSLTRTTGVATRPDGATLASDEIAAWVPYRLPDGVPAAPKPTMELSPAGPYANGDRVEFTIGNLPNGLDYDIGLGPSNIPLGQCTSDDLTTRADCRYPPVEEFETVSDTDTGLTTVHGRVTVQSCGEPRGCYLAFTGVGGNGYPALVQSERFDVSG